MDDIEAAEQRVQATLNEIRQALTAAGLKYVDAGHFVMGAGVAVAWADGLYALLSVANFLDNQFSITYGVVRDIHMDRPAALELCNRHNQNIAAYPAYLHDAQNGWDILQQNVLPLQVLRDAPQFVFGFYLTGNPQIVDGLRSQAVAAGLGGQPYRWDQENLGRLLPRSLL